ncbi:MAG TPA: hypothetical protein VMW75_11230 [Thermoanaerobaculia bacterium]|nr:hypothetical protein [Thermoanaerobaculia bacterium]
MSYRRLRTRFSCPVILAAIPALAGLAALAEIVARGPVPLAAQEPPPALPTLLAWQSPPAGACVPSRNVGCSNHGRFSVAVTWQNQFNNTSGKGVVVAAASTDQTLAFSFGDPANIELLVKLLNFGDVVKLFYGELTDLHFQITVTDNAHGISKVYTNTPGDCGAIDGSAFPGQGARPGEDAGEQVNGAPLVSGATVSCHPNATTLCLLGGRFAANVTWQNQFSGGVIGSGMAGPLSSETGTFYFTDPTNKELLVKILDFGNRFAVFYGSLSNLQYTLQVTDTSTGGTRTYFNPPGTFCGGLDNAFPGNLTASTAFTLIPVPVANSEGRSDDVALVPFTITTGGTLQIEADWMSAADNVQLVLFGGDCTLQDAVQNLCDKNQIAAARGMVKPQQLVQPGLAPGTYTIEVINFGPNDESGTMTATLTH